MFNTSGKYGKNAGLAHEQSHIKTATLFIWRKQGSNLNSCEKMEWINRLYIHMIECYTAVTMNERESYESILDRFLKILNGKRNRKILHSV